jgi:hypothetical protein
MCDCCGCEKDMMVKEVYPYPDDGIITDPIDPLLEMHVDGETPVTRLALMCHPCFHRIGPEMWILEDHWKALNPVVPFAQLPELT